MVGYRTFRKCLNREKTALISGFIKEVPENWLVLLNRWGNISSKNQKVEHTSDYESNSILKKASTMIKVNIWFYKLSRLWQFVTVFQWNKDN